MSVLAAKPRQQSSAKERGFAGTRWAENDEQRLHAGLAHPTKSVETANDRRVPAEENGRIDFLQRFPPAIWGPIRLARWRPRKGLRTDPGAAERFPEPLQTLRQEQDQIRSISDVDFGLRTISE